MAGDPLGAARNGFGDASPLLETFQRSPLLLRDARTLRDSPGSPIEPPDLPFALCKCAKSLNPGRLFWMGSPYAFEFAATLRRRARRPRP